MIYRSNTGLSRRASRVRRGSGGVTRGFSFARRTTGGRYPGPSAGALACAACSCRISSPPACGASRSVAGVTGKTWPSACRDKPRQRGEPGPVGRRFRTRSACRRRTAFSCRSTSSSASFARSLRNTRTARPRPGTRASRRSRLAPGQPTISTSSLLATAQVSHSIEYSSGTGAGRAGPRGASRGVRLPGRRAGAGRAGPGVAAAGGLG